MTTEPNTGALRVSGIASDPKRLGRLIFGGLFLAIFVGYYMAASELSEGTLQSPGPGMFPTWVGIAGIAVSVIVLVEGILGRSESGEIGFPRGKYLKDVLIFVAFLIGYVALLPFLGQYIASVLFAVGFIWAVASIAWWKAILIGAAMAVIVTYFFSGVLGLNLPSGFL